MKIVGVSFDPSPLNAQFKETNNFLYPLWSDTAKELALYYGAASSNTQKTASRITILLAGDGSWLLTYAPGIFTLVDHPGEVLADCQAIFGD